MQTLDQLMLKAIPDLWTRNKLGKIIVRRPNIFSNSGDTSITARIDYESESASDTLNSYKDRRDIPNPAVAAWKPQLVAYGLFPVIEGMELHAQTKERYFSEQRAADILNSMSVIVTPFSLKQRYGTTISSRELFNIGTRKGLSEQDIVARIKEYYSTQRALA